MIFSPAPLCSALRSPAIFSGGRGFFYPFTSISFPLLLCLHPFSLLAMRAFKALPKCDLLPAFGSAFLGSQLCVAVATGRNIWWSLHIGKLHVHHDGIATADFCGCFVMSL